MAPAHDPIDRFRELLGRASALDRALLPEPTAFALGTVGDDGQPSVRIVLLKDVDQRGFVFYTNLEGRKGRELLAHPRAAMCFHWQPLELQVRVEGTAVPVTPAEADAYFATRARGSQIGAWASLQSRAIEPAGELERRVAEYERRFADGPVPRPPHWSGFRIVPHRIEFWQGRPSRLHDRDLYERGADGEWTVRTLYP
ncbi:MAG TPA: pyridoxamine 5'-phosphate oxidase [Gemmatimonadaceae bacterium]|nr:pyridoxamine 5'-phosphate oxidase [Gemmatimonadaceae bacterium]